MGPRFDSVENDAEVGKHAYHEERPATLGG